MRRHSWRQNVDQQLVHTPNAVLSFWNPSRTCADVLAASTGVPGQVQLSPEAFTYLFPPERADCTVRQGVFMKGKGVIDTYLANFDPDGLGHKYWRNFRRFEKMAKVWGSARIGGLGAVRVRLWHRDTATKFVHPCR